MSCNLVSRDRVRHAMILTSHPRWNMETIMKSLFAAVTLGVGLILAGSGGASAAPLALQTQSAALSGDRSDDLVTVGYRRHYRHHGYRSYGYGYPSYGYNSYGYDPYRSYGYGSSFGLYSGGGLSFSIGPRYRSHHHGYRYRGW
jgi:hypothetical protein